MLAAPFIVASLLVIALGLMALLIRGDALVRTGLLCVFAAVLPWSVGSAYAITLDDPTRVQQVSKIYMSSVSLIGPALMFLVLAITRRVRRHRILVAVATASAATTTVLTLTTDLVIDGVWEMPWGGYYPLSGGSVGVVHIIQFVVWAAIGGLIASRARTRERSERRRVNTALVVVGLVIATTGATDLLLFHGHGVYPFSSLSAITALSVFLFSLFKQDLMHMRGFDRSGGYEMLALVGVACAGFAVATALGNRPSSLGPLTIAAATAPLLLVAHVAVAEIRRRNKSTGASERTLDDDHEVQAYVARVGNRRDRSALASDLSSLLDTTFGLSELRLLTVEDDQWHVISGEAMSRVVRVDTRVRAWLVANRAPLVDEDLPSRRLGGLRRPIEGLMRSLDAEIFVPLVDRASLVGAIVTAQPHDGRALREDQLKGLTSVADATAAALTYVDLLDAAEQRVEVAREVEVAAAVQRARAPGQETTEYERCRVVRHYQPAESFTGSWWTHTELPDGRVLAAMGEIAGAGVPAALVSGTILGAAETATSMLGGGLDVLTYLELLNASLLEIGGETYAMSAFAAVFDVECGHVTFANAAHPAPYRCRGPADRRGRAQLRALVSRGTPLGSAEPVLSAASLPLAPGDVVVMHSEPLARSRSPEGVEFGDRRIQHLLRRHALGAGETLSQMVVEDALAHFAGPGPEGDLVVIAVHVNGSSAHDPESA